MGVEHDKMIQDRECLVVVGFAGSGLRYRALSFLMVRDAIDSVEVAAADSLCGSGFVYSCCQDVPRLLAASSRKQQSSRV